MSETEARCGNCKHFFFDMDDSQNPGRCAAKVPFWALGAYSFGLARNSSTVVTELTHESGENCAAWEPSNKGGD